MQSVTCAIIATLFGFPAARSRSLVALNIGLSDFAIPVLIRKLLMPISPKLIFVQKFARD